MTGKAGDETQSRSPPARAGDSRAARRHADALLDLALEQSFPASDPPSITMPHPRKAPS